MSDAAADSAAAPDPGTPYRIEVSLWIVDGMVETFQTYEASAAEVMAELGARVAEVRTPLRASDEDPHEIHVVHYPDRAAYDAYRVHPRLRDLAELRASCIARSEVTVVDLD